MTTTPVSFITFPEFPQMKFTTHRKYKPTVGRFATEEEVARYNAFVESRESKKPLRLGDFIAEDTIDGKDNEWVVPQEAICDPQKYLYLGWNADHTRERFKSIEVRYAARIEQDEITVNGHTGVKGDYLVYSEVSTPDQGWIVEAEAFASTYKTVEQLEQEQHAAWQARLQEIEAESKRTQEVIDEDLIELALLRFLTGEHTWPLKLMTPQEMYLDALPEERQALYL